jgi:hypothetical protein
LDAGGRGPFRGQDAPCARRDYFIKIRRGLGDFAPDS